jgi:hypothetical protein
MIAGHEFLTMAELWVTGATEAEWRSAVSRANHAAFHAARQLLRAFSFTVPGGDQAHAYLWLRRRGQMTLSEPEASATDIP